MEKFLVKKFPINADDISEANFDKSAYEEEHKCILSTVHIGYENAFVVAIYEVKKNELGWSAT